MLRVLTRYPRSLRVPLPRLNKYHQRPRNITTTSGRMQSLIDPVGEPPKASLTDSTGPAATGPTNRHISVDAEGVEQVDLEFIDEPIGVPADKGHGFARFDFGDTIGPEDRYKIVRKLGWGLNSSVWMAFDEKEKKYVAIKALKGFTTDLVKKGLVWEHCALGRVSSTDLGPTSKHCIKLLTQFTQPGQAEDGEHLCFVTEVLGGDVKSLQLQGQEDNRTPFPLPLAKRILLHTLRGLAHLHGRGIVHTDLKSDNIMFDRGPLSTEDITALVAADPPRRNPPEYSWQCIIQSAVNQPLPVPPLSEAMARTYLLADLGSAQPINAHSVDEITPVDLRAPETLLRGPWNEKVDIWTFGCLVFELVVCSMLFRYEAYPAHDLDEAGGLLWQMMCFTGETFKPDQLQASKRASTYFNGYGQLKSLPPSFRNPFEHSLRNYGVLEEQDVVATAAFMQRILRLDPADRPSAEELLQDSWLQGVE